MNTPETFAEWCDIFENFRNRLNDEENLKAAYEGTFKPETGVADMWAEEFLRSINERIKLAQSRFERDMSHAHGSEAEIHRALSSLKRELKYIYQFSKLPCKSEIKSLTDCEKLVLDTAKTIESSLINSAKNDRSGKLSVIVRNFKISEITE